MYYSELYFWYKSETYNFAHFRPLFGLSHFHWCDFLLFPPFGWHWCIHWCISFLRMNYFKSNALIRVKRRDLTQSYDKRPYTHRKKSKKQHDNEKTPPKTSITQRLRTDLGRSVVVTIATQLVWLNRFTGSQPSH